MQMFEKLHENLGVIFLSVLAAVIFLGLAAINDKVAAPAEVCMGNELSMSNVPKSKDVVWIDCSHKGGKRHHKKEVYSYVQIPRSTDLNTGSRHPGNRGAGFSANRVNV